LALAKTQYVRSGDADIAYQVFGDGPRDIVLVFDWASHLEEIGEQPAMADFVRGLQRFARVLWFDMRGIGMSSAVAGGVIPVETWMDDLVAVLDAAGSTEATIVAQGHAAQMAVVAAASHPERVRSLVLINGYARFTRTDDYPEGLPVEHADGFLDPIEAQWGTGLDVSVLAPSIAGRPGIQEWWGRVERYVATPALARAKMRAIFDLDVRNVLPLVSVPTLVVHNSGNDFVRVGHGRYLAEHIAGAEWLERDTPDHWPLPAADLLGAIEEFVTGTRTQVSEADRVLATVAFIDVAGSTERASELGDHGWRSALERFERDVHDALRLYDGRLENTAGDGVLATFDGPARGIRCAWHIRDEVRRSGLHVRCGLHAGEVMRRDAGLAGIAVHIGARVSAMAEPDEVLVTRTVRDLVAGSGIAFEERGEHELKGVPDRWALYAAVG
jgi:class 3 adenylate cyclase